MLKKVLKLPLFTQILLVLGIVIPLLATLTENREKLLPLSNAMVAGLRSVQIPSNFVGCMFGHPDTAASGGLLPASTPPDALFERLCTFSAGPLKFVPALGYALIKGFTADGWGVAFSLVLCLLCVSIVRDVFRGETGFVEALWQVALAVLLLWLLTVVLIWVFTGFSYLLGVIATWSTTILGASAVWTLFTTGREIRKNVAEVIETPPANPEEEAGRA